MRTIPANSNKMALAPETQTKARSFQEVKQLIDQLNRQQEIALQIIKQYSDKV